MSADGRRGSDAAPAAAADCIERGKPARWHGSRPAALAKNVSQPGAAQQRAPGALAIVADMKPSAPTRAKSEFLNTMRYRNHNYYYFAENNAWCVLNYTDETWPRGYALFFTASSGNDEYAEAVTLMTYMRLEDVQRWAHTFNTVSHEVSRGEDYEAFKQEKAEKLFDFVEEKFAGFKDSIDSYYTRYAAVGT